MNLLIKSQRVIPDFSEKDAYPEHRAAPGAAVDSENTGFDSDIQAVIDAWPVLPEAVKAGIVAMIRAAKSAI